MVKKKKEVSLLNTQTNRLPGRRPRRRQTVAAIRRPVRWLAQRTRLEGSQGDAKLLPLLEVAAAHVVNTHGKAQRLPGHQDAADGQHLIGVLQR